ncbi:Bug family tripartite tricarboxylate transporter substrate binding protein [Neoroseomonas oryzicola]|uniref:Tripartite tricarboxylate transporter substrate binding protein n=1 Tax=Neoroseomonas oryzicola TaxID=535904 RepID=A0A9X9WBZ5_9PROT|nr:tripartite tricarboxylate transporter substrate binding protein [Neoroseomonas oryzicola]MBR0657855.1 tripartite tricarboxylate transporter substrate binding protein [Neoroseomonas oryzicola]NKE18577.1 tripartite tricarboxylate transporter substrate binding protein [Neoroseomonas oryzicola]
MPDDIRLHRRHLLAAGGAALAGPALAQPAEWRPTQPVRIVVAAAPGGTLDIHARAAQPLLAQRLGQAVVVENQGGAAGRVAAMQVGRAAPDGHTLLVGSGDGIVLQDILLSARQGRARANLRAVTMTISAAQLLVTHPRSGLRSVQDYVAALRTRGERVTLAVPGIGGIAHIISEMVNRQLGLKVTHVPYRGGGPATLDLLAGQVDAMIITLPAVTTHVREGRLVPLAVSTLARDPALPDTPSFAESVAPGFDVPSTQGALVPAGTPDPVVAALYSAWRDALADAGVKARLEALGFVIHASTPAEFERSLADSEARFAEVISAAGIRSEDG